MAKITRATQTVFGASGATSNFGEFGSLALGTPTTTKTPSVIQSLAAWLQGWQAATIGAFIPAYQDMNSVHYLAFYQICYLLQMGISEYDPSTTYYIDSICQYNGLQYQSLIDNNTGNQPDTNPSYWLCISTTAYGGTVASASSITLPNLGNSFKITGSTTINSISIKPAGIIVNLIFTGSPLITLSGNILLNPGTFSALPNATLVLISDGTNWFEISRSPANQVGAMVSASDNTPNFASTAIMGYGTATGGQEDGLQIVAGQVSGVWTQSILAQINNPANSGQVAFVCMIIPKGWYWGVYNYNGGTVTTCSYSPIGI